MRSARIGALTIIAALLLGSGVVRLGGSAGAALAEGQAPAAPEGGDRAEMVCEASEVPTELLAALREREARVIEREARIDQRMQALELAEVEIQDQLVALAEAEASLSAMLDLAGSAAEDDIGRLTLVYENMPPEEVAALFEEMAPEFSSGFLARMAPEAAAAVMSNLTPTTAYSISVVIAGRHSGVPTD